MIYSRSFSLSVAQSMISCKPILPFNQSNSAHNHLYIGVVLIYCLKTQSYLNSKSFAQQGKQQKKGQSTDWEKISANYVTNKGLVSKIYKQLRPITASNSPLKKWAGNLNRHFSKDDIHVANRHMKRCSTSVVIREMQIRSTMRYHLSPVRKAIIKKSTNTKYWRV